MKRILVLDGDMGSALAIVRSLGRHGWSVDVANSKAGGIASTSRFCQKKLVYPDPLLSEALYLDWMREALKRDDYDLIIPVTERTLVPLMKIREVPGAAKLAMASNEALEIVLDKTKTTALAASLGIPLPKNISIHEKSEVENILNSRDFETLLSSGSPVVLKPGRSIGKTAGERKKLDVQYAFNKKDAKRRIENLLGFGEVIVQEYFPGDGVGVELLAQDGEILYSFQHQRIHELPLTGGASCLRRSVPLEASLLEASQKLMKALKWTGVAMVEFKWNPSTQKFIFVEINGRFWGSLPLAVAAGADFPVMLCELMFQQSLSPRPSYRPFVYARNLAKDLDWYELVLRRQTPEGFRGIWENKKQLLVDFLRIFSPSHVFDIQQWRDPLPGLIDLNHFFKKQYGRLSDLWELRKYMAFHRKKWTQGEAPDAIKKAKGILFVCLGNINRSALAERYYKTIYSTSPVSVRSCGFYPIAQRPADPVMVLEAQQAGVDLTTWSSTSLNEELLNSSDVILVMEHAHWLKIKTEYPASLNKTYLLGCASSTSGHQVEIDDPYGKSPESYRHCIEHVISSVNEVVSLVKKAHESE